MGGFFHYFRANLRQNSLHSFSLRFQEGISLRTADDEGRNAEGWQIFPYIEILPDSSVINALFPFSAKTEPVSSIRCTIRDGLYVESESIIIKISKNIPVSVCMKNS